MALSLTTLAFSQNYTEYTTGSTTDVDTNHEPGVCLMGGATENDEAMVWFLDKADGGDVLVLRADGSDGYNDYFFTDLGVTLNSVTTLVIENELGALDPFVLQKVADAEAIWFAGGDQFDYVSFFKDNAMEMALNDFINVKQGVIGGTSAGMAIMGTSYFSAENGTLDSDVALSNPYHPRVTLGYDDFLEVPYMENVITDSHFANRDREGRMSVFLARFVEDNNERSYGIASNDYVAVCVEPDGKAYVYGEFPDFTNEFAYFFQANCTTDYEPETVVSGSPVTWDQSGEAIKVYKVTGTYGGPNYFDLSDWETGVGGVWENWSVDNGVLTIADGINPECSLLSIAENKNVSFEVYPNPFRNSIQINAKTPILSANLFDSLGREISIQFENDTVENLERLKTGVYFLQVSTSQSTETLQLLKH